LKASSNRARGRASDRGHARPKRMTENSGAQLKKITATNSRLLQVIRIVYCFTTTEYLLLTTSRAGIASANRSAIPNGNCGTPFGGGGNAPAVSDTYPRHPAAVLVSLVSTAAMRMRVVLPGVAGAVTLTEMVWLIESDFPEPGTGLGRTLTTVQATLLLEAESVNEVAYADESL
jgi:hypothetical protein